MRLSTGSSLGPYEISRPIGAGGMGEVYRARDTRLGREVALKVLPQELSGDAERLARFEREACSASALNHPGIVTIYDFASRDGETYLVMELIRGESLRETVTRGPLPLKRLFSIAAGVADALAAAHAAGLVHRDLKPENVMLTSDDVPKILDFGLVKSSPVPADGANSPTNLLVSHTGMLLGTAHYMSPEQARGESVDFRSDQFSFGLILYEMATGRHPFRRATPFETVAAILNDDPEPLSDSFPEPFVWTVERCLTKKPSERYGSTADLARDLMRLRDRSSSGGVRPVSGRGPVMERRWWMAATAAAVLVAVIAIETATARRRQTGVGDPIQVEVATPQIADVYLGEVALPVVISPDGRYLVVYGVGSAGTNDLWLHDLRSGATRSLAENAFSAAWSSDSEAIAYFAEGKLKTVAVGGGPARNVCDARPEGTPTWHGDTILFAQYSKDPGIYRVSAGGGTPERIIKPTASESPACRGGRSSCRTEGASSILDSFNRQSRERSCTSCSWDRSMARHPRRIAAIDARAVFVEGHLLFVRDGTLLAQPFDPDALRFTGEATPLLDDLHYFRNTGLAAFSVSQNGLLAWRSARQPVRLAWLDRGGKELGSIGTLLARDSGRLSPDGKRYAVGVVDPKQGVSDIWIYDLAREATRPRCGSPKIAERAPAGARMGRSCSSSPPAGV